MEVYGDVQGTPLPTVSLVCSLLKSTVLMLACVLYWGDMVTASRCIQFQTSNRMGLALGLWCLPEAVLRGGVASETTMPLGLFCAHTSCVLGSYRALILHPQANSSF